MKSKEIRIDGRLFPSNRIRALVILDYCLRAGYKRVVTLSCGNVSRAIQEIINENNLPVYPVDVSPSDEAQLSPGRWLDPAEVTKIFGFKTFDATSGHLPFHLMIRIARAYRDYLGELRGTVYTIPTGSGETVVCLRLAYPELTIRAQYNTGSLATLYDERAPLNVAVEALADEILGLQDNGPSQDRR